MFRFKIDFILLLVFRICALVSAGLVLLIVLFVVSESWPSFQTPGFLAFFSDSSWHPTEGFFNLVPMLWGSILVTLGAVALSAPVGILSAVYCHFYGPPRLVKIYRKLIELLAGIPSVVFGFWGLMVLVPIISEIAQPGASLLAGIIVLFIMILPTMAMASDAAIANTPHELVEGAEALGFSKFRTIFSVVLPAAKSGLVVGLILQVGRAIGETMAVLMVTGNVVQIPKSIFDPVRTLTSNIALEMAYAMGTHRSALFFSGFILILLIFTLVWLSDLVEVSRRANWN